MINTKRKRFYEESLKLIHSKGFKATTMRDLAEQLDCDVANLYNYIDSKQSLLERFLFDASDEFHRSVDLINRSGYSPEDKLRKVVELYVRLTREKPYQLSLLVNEWRHLKEEKLNLFLKARSEYEGKVAQIIKDGMSSGVFKSMDVDLATHLFLSALRLLFDKYTDPSSGINPVELERQIIQFIFAGILDKK